MRPPQGIEVAVAGGTLAAWRLSAGPAGPVLAVHGITSTSRVWLAVAAELEGAAELVAIDLRGRGASSRLPGPHGLDAHAEDLVATLDALGLQRAVLCGHSLGAWIACRLALRHPERVTRLVLLDGGVPDGEAGTLDDVAADARMSATLGPDLERLRAPFADRDAYRAWWAAHPAYVDAPVDADVLDAMSDWDLGGEPPLLRPTVDEAAVRTDGRELLGARDAEAMRTPAVLLHASCGLDGAPPPLLDPARVERWARAGVDRRALIVPGANHYTIAVGRPAARVVADEILAALAPRDIGPELR